MKNTINFKVLSKSWRLRLMDMKSFAKHHGHENLAVADQEKRRIDLSPLGKSLETITHELVHAYLYELCVKSCDLDDDNLEEVFAELLSKRGRELLNLADRLKKGVNRLTA